MVWMGIQTLTLFLRIKAPHLHLQERKRGTLLRRGSLLKVCRSLHFRGRAHRLRRPHPSEGRAEGIQTECLGEGGTRVSKEVRGP